MSNFFIPTPWDQKVFGVDTFEINEYTEDSLVEARCTGGHYTIRVDPLVSKKLLHQYGFYYCDTLVEPHSTRERFRPWPKQEVAVELDPGIEDLIEICNSAFQHGRFHRDFNLDKSQADLRYDNWLRQLYAQGNAFGISYENHTVCFFGYFESKILLHAVSEKVRGSGLAKYLWSAGCRHLFDKGNEELTSSVSASNTAVLNLYGSLGFRFRRPVDIYHGIF
jgi:ribosomal protein S18 acetylase RimI-like enzyme